MNATLETIEVHSNAILSANKGPATVVYDSHNLTASLSNWMTNLPAPLRKLPVIYLAIPGSHDSGSYAITRHSEIAPDLEEGILKLKFLGPIFYHVVSNWSRAQDYDADYQLNAGVRYFDLRIALKLKEFYLVHGLYGAPLIEVLRHIVEFLEKNLGEIVIIDCQHFYDLSDEDHNVLANIFYKCFDKKIVPCENNYMKHLTLNYLQANHYQVILVYRHPEYRNFKFFPSCSFPTPWPNTTDEDKLIMLLDENLKGRNGNTGYVTQFLLTPSKWTIILGICSNLKKFFALPLLRNKLSWVKRQSPGHDGVNVIISDFIDANNCEFTRAIVNLNCKLIPKDYQQQRQQSTHSTPYLPPICD